MRMIISPAKKMNAKEEVLPWQNLPVFLDRTETILKWMQSLSLEEAKELVDRLNAQKNLPMFTSCCPGWVSYCETCHPELINNLSSCKSPQQMFGAMTKTYFAEREGLNKDNIVVVSVMPCTAKNMRRHVPMKMQQGYRMLTTLLQIVNLRE